MLFSTYLKEAKGQQRQDLLAIQAMAKKQGCILYHIDNIIDLPLDIQRNLSKIRNHEHEYKTFPRRSPQAVKA